MAPEGKRNFDLSGQVYFPGDKTRSQRFYSLHFCRQCGQEYHPVWNEMDEGQQLLNPRDISERDNDEEENHWGFFMFDVKQAWDDADPTRYPEQWLEDLCNEQSEWDNLAFPELKSVSPGSKSKPNCRRVLFNWRNPGDQ